MKNVTSIVHPKFGEITTVMIKGEPWFMAKSVCDALELSEVSNIVKRLDDDEKLRRTVFVSGQGREMWFVNESGLYNLIFQSRKPEARLFRKWVTAEVLPSIRKNGYYVTGNAAADRKALRLQRKQMLKEMQKYLVAEDIMKCSKRLDLDDLYVKEVLRGESDNNNVMADLQERAIANRKKWFDAYSEERIEEVIKILTGDVE